MGDLAVGAYRRGLETSFTGRKLERTLALLPSEEGEAKRWHLAFGPDTSPRSTAVRSTAAVSSCGRVGNASPA